MQIYSSINEKEITFATDKKSDDYNCKCKSVVHNTLKSENYRTITIEVNSNTNSYDFLYITEGGGIYKTNNTIHFFKNQ